MLNEWVTTLKEMVNDSLGRDLLPSVSSFMMPTKLGTGEYARLEQTHVHCIVVPQVDTRNSSGVLQSDIGHDALDGLRTYIYRK